MPVGPARAPGSRARDVRTARRIRVHAGPDRGVAERRGRRRVPGLPRLRPGRRLRSAAPPPPQLQRGRSERAADPLRRRAGADQPARASDRDGSPVPLMATFEARHVLQASTYSKSVLRVACEELVRSRAQAHYFASYEIVTASGDSNSYFAPDRRSVTPAAVEHVIACFRRLYMAADAAPPDAEPQPAAVAPTLPEQPLCDEQLVMDALARHAARET